MLKGKHIVLGISGGIAAYKTPMLIRLFVKEGAEVRVVATHNALEFVTPLVLETLSGNKVYTDVFASGNDHTTEHVSLPDWADLMVVAPATANIIGKMANGIADDALSTTFLAMRKPVLVAPAMNEGMLAHPAVQSNIQRINAFPHCTVLPTEDGFLACGAIGQGRMLEPDAICRQSNALLVEQDLKGRRILITGGPTREKLDPVRFISNFSSGKMSISIAEECAQRGAEVLFVLGPCNLRPTQLPLNPMRMMVVESAEEMLNATEKAFSEADTTILCAAVADYRPAHYSTEKIKKEPPDQKHDTALQLVENADIAARLGVLKRPGQTLVGFALETSNAKCNALDKMHRKNLDFIVLNSLEDAGAGFGCDTNKITIYSSAGISKVFPLQSKREAATCIINAIIGREEAKGER